MRRSQGVTGGSQNFKNRSKEAFLGRIFYLGVRKGHIILIWGYAEGYNLGVRGYEKVENPAVKLLSIPVTVGLNKS